jgi:hypothetical protein
VLEDRLGENLNNARKNHEMLKIKLEIIVHLSW